MPFRDFRSGQIERLVQPGEYSGMYPFPREWFFHRQLGVGGFGIAVLWYWFDDEDNAVRDSVVVKHIEEVQWSEPLRWRDLKPLEIAAMEDLQNVAECPQIPKLRG